MRISDWSSDVCSSDLQVIPDGPEALGWFKRPIASLEDFRKMKFRTPPGLPGQVYTEMGVSVTGLPGPEIIPAAERGVIDAGEWINPARSEEHTSELQSLLRISYAVFCLKNNKKRKLRAYKQ